MELIWEELGPKFKDLLGMGKPGVIASVVAASQRLHSHEQKVYANVNPLKCLLLASEVEIVQHYLRKEIKGLSFVVVVICLFT